MASYLRMKSVRLGGVLAALPLVLLAACGHEAATGDPSAAVGGAGVGGFGGAGGAVVASGGSGGVTTSGQGGACSMVEPLPITYYDVNHVLSTGQSLSIGVAGTPALSTTQPLDNTMFDGGLDMVDANDLANASFVPLIEGTSPQQETMSSGLANLVSLMARDEVLACQPAGEQRHDIFVSVHGRGSTRYAGLKKGTEVYNNGLAQVTAAYELAQDNGQSYTVRAVTTVHGESDHTAGILVYEANLVEWQSDLQTDIQAITSQTEPVPMFQSQISNWARLGGATSVIPSAQLAASEANPEAIIVVGPKYALPYAADGVHLTNHGYRQMGELYAKAYRAAILEGQGWSPVRPLSISRNATVITVSFAVPAPPLVLDTTLVTDPGNFGFEYVDDSLVPPAIVDVAVTGPTVVTVTLATVPTGANQRLRYAYTGVDGAPSGPLTGPRGNLRDSDATVSAHGYDLSNWCVHFDKPVL